ncbi:MAG: hypothetical protein ABIO29_06200 [Sphingomicrobium sp.]
MRRTILISTLVSGTLDILLAMILTVMRGKAVGDMLRVVASGPFPAAKDMGPVGAALGLGVHFTLMAIMAAIFALIVRARPRLLDRPLVTGALYGLATYVVMNLIVVPWRFGAPLPPPPLSIATQLFAHVVLVGIPFALIARRTIRRSAFA